MRKHINVTRSMQFRAEDLKSLTEQRNDAVQAMKDMTDAAETEHRAFTDAETAEFDKLEKSVKTLDSSIERMERARDLSLNVISPKRREALEKEELEERAFESYIRGVVEERADANLTKGDNGAVIPTTIANKIIKKVHEISPIYRMATKYNVAGTLQIPYYPATVEGETPDVSMAYATEFTDLESTSGKFGSISLTGFLAGALTKVSKSLVNNAKFDVVSFVVNNMSESIARWVEGQCINGTSQKVTGAIAGITQVVTAASTAAVTADELIDVQEAVPDEFQNKACWIMSKATRTAIRKLKDGQGNYLLNKDYGAKWGYTLLGKDVYVSENMPNMSASAAAIMYGDFSGLAVKLSEAMEIQILREKFATQHAIGVVAWMEFDAKVENAQKLSKLVMHA